MTAKCNTTKGYLNGPPSYLSLTVKCKYLGGGKIIIDNCSRKLIAPSYASYFMRCISILIHCDFCAYTPLGENYFFSDLVLS